MAKRGESISAELKFKVVLETLREESSLAEIASKDNVPICQYRIQVPFYSTQSSYF